jgi:hypothetical protein
MEEVVGLAKFGEGETVGVVIDALVWRCKLGCANAKYPNAKMIIAMKKVINTALCRIRFGTDVFVCMFSPLKDN